MADGRMHNRVPKIFRGIDEQISSFIRTHRETTTGKILLLLPSILAIALLIGLPSIILIDLSFKPFIEGSVVSGFTLGHYERIFTRDINQKVIFRTLKIAVVVTTLDLLLGYPLAYTAVRGGTWTGRLIVVATLTPLAIDIVVRTFGWFLLLSDGGLIQQLLIAITPYTTETVPQLLYNEIAIIIGLTHVLLPFMVFPLINVFHTIPQSLEAAGRDLGANRIKVLAKVLLPLSMPGIAAGTLMVFAIVLASYVTPAMLGGSTNVMAIRITDTFLDSSNWAFGSAMAVVLLVIGVFIILGYQRALRSMDDEGGVI